MAWTACPRSTGLSVSSMPIFLNVRGVLLDWAARAVMQTVLTVDGRVHDGEIACSSWWLWLWWWWCILAAAAEASLEEMRLRRSLSILVRGHLFSFFLFFFCFFFLGLGSYQMAGLELVLSDDGGWGNCNIINTYVYRVLCK